MFQSKRYLAAGAITALLISLRPDAPAYAAADPVSFADKTVTMIIGSAAGGGTDVTGRLVATYLNRYLPGQPTVIVRNMPGAGGITAMNHMVHQTKPDGLTILSGATPQVDPQNYRKANAQYDPGDFRYVGGVGRGGYVLLISAKADERLRQRSGDPVIMGSVPGIPRNAMQMTMWGIEYLGWNAKWVAGYPGTNELTLALDRGEIDMTATGNIFEINERVNSGKFKIVCQTGNMEGEKILPRPEFMTTPVFPQMMEGKITDPIAQKAFDYWISINSVDKFMAVAPGTAEPLMAAYRAAFDKMSQDDGFLTKGRSISDDFVPMPGSDIEQRVKILAATPTEATDYIKTLMRGQGLNVD